MRNSHRIYISGATRFFTANLANRHNNNLLIEKINSPRSAFAYVKRRRPFDIKAVVILPDHLHCIWTLPPDDSDFSTRWNLLKGHFSRAIGKDEIISKSRYKRRERGIWQRRFWAHLITDQDDFNRHMDYIHFNPVKHDWVKQTVEWPYSSFHKFVDLGIYSATWGYSGESIVCAGEYAVDALPASAHPMLPGFAGGG